MNLLVLEESLSTLDRLERMILAVESFHRLISIVERSMIMTYLFVWSWIGRKRKEIIEGLPMEVVRERRAQRMIKNRESALKSRSRKQTYTFQLEAELALLHAENDSLKNQVN